MLAFGDWAWEAAQRLSGELGSGVLGEPEDDEGGGGLACSESLEPSRKVRTGTWPLDSEASDLVSLGSWRKGQEGMGTAGRQPFPNVSAEGEEKV